MYRLSALLTASPHPDQLKRRLPCLSCHDEYLRHFSPSYLVVSLAKSNFSCLRVMLMEQLMLLLLILVVLFSAAVCIVGLNCASINIYMSMVQWYAVCCCRSNLPAAETLFQSVYFLLIVFTEPAYLSSRTSIVASILVIINILILEARFENSFL